MAAIRLSGDVKQVIMNKLELRFDTIIKRINDEISELRVAEHVMQDILSIEVLETINRLEKLTGHPYWVKKTKSVNVIVRYTLDGEQHLSRLYEDLSSPMYAPDNFSGYSSSLELKATSPIYPKTVELLAKKQQFIADKKYVIDEVYRQVLHPCSTINQAVELWPTVINYLPEQYLAAYRKQQAPARKPKEVKSRGLSDRAKVILIKISMGGI